MKKYFFLLVLNYPLLSVAQVNESLPKLPLTEEWKAKILSLAPAISEVPAKKKRKVLVFSLHTGYNHWVIPHTEAMIEILAQKSNAFEVVASRDISVFEKKKLKQFDAIVLNNNCPGREKRDIFYDVLKSRLPKNELMAKAKKLEKNIIHFVRKGGGLVGFHGGSTMQMFSTEFSNMLGGSFHYHPPQQSIEVKLVEKDHPITRAFDGESFNHVDEPYFFGNAYQQKDFRPLLYMETSKIKGIKHEPIDEVSYLAWVKKYGKGRVFYASPSHNAQSFENPRLLKFFLNGIQYALGDLACDDSPIAK